MDSINRTQYERKETNPTILLQKSIILLLSRWYALQMAIENQWGGCDSLQKSHQLAADLFSWFSKSNALIPVEDLENLLYESMLLTFNTEIEDGSIEQHYMRLLRQQMTFGQPMYLVHRPVVETNVVDGFLSLKCFYNHLTLMLMSSINLKFYRYHVTSPITASTIVFGIPPQTSNFTSQKTFESAFHMSNVATNSAVSIHWTLEISKATPYANQQFERDRTAQHRASSPTNEETNPRSSLFRRLLRSLAK
ncbi:unnamed protein product [Sphenostylis stenocarpa]|uniref:Pre-rRNA-processing protein TSR2 n=1 Tax=Sphenostylis stenocarpa TaxID=92480 RepID=A0AA86VB56_9FABA|nr:unnamed protein product [Sphenostylis stenocarpa]